MRFSARTKHRFWDRVNKLGPIHPDIGTRCWEWKACDYGTFWWLGVSWQSHRFSWVMKHKKNIPKGLCVLHRCDNRKCVRPDHLFLGTWLDNARDRDAKGRGSKILRQKGENHPASKISDHARYVVIPKLHRRGWSAKNIANKFNMTVQNVRVILRKQGLGSTVNNG